MSLLGLLPYLDLISLGGRYLITRREDLSDVGAFASSTRRDGKKKKQNKTREKFFTRLAHHANERGS